jgi:uncharacterized damage-inducible protein DinB
MGIINFIIYNKKRIPSLISFNARAGRALAHMATAEPFWINAIPSIVA